MILGPGQRGYPCVHGSFERECDKCHAQDVQAIVDLFERRKQVHYRNGREAKNGDKVVRLTSEGKIEAFGVLHSAKADGGSHCNGSIAVVQSSAEYACLCDCIHIDDLAAILKEKGLDKRPEGM